MIATMIYISIIIQGNKQWAGKEDCEPVTWQECELVDMPKNFPVPTVNCSKVNPIPYCDYKQVDSTAMKNKLKCEVSSVSVRRLIVERRK